ncbi:hypothetical protein L228DRAFT_271080 [Xylona heveae TC161]|uniref:DUF1772-domain-containing protein n=1 Tax=Xylona heveae (strain CBS 132557 / TC161) TaxID=1328760 RepID=A0A165A012_XYLHT|nr:hypothetical protein L228DRAFT_271080 [Xylona heveae TC161]KZF19759.1 hypothetical protein L228DRAFT_271080 [Xylona heveae TC161]
MTSSSNLLPIYRLLPGLTATAALSYAASEYWVLVPFLHRDIPKEAPGIWWNQALWPGTAGVLAIGWTSVGAGILSMRHTAGEAQSLYKWGAIFAAAHFIFAPFVAQVIKRTVYGPPENSKNEVRTWLKIHTLRTIVADLPAAICFLRAFLATL